MSTAGALPRLLWRPALLWTLFPLFWAVAVPLLLLAESDVPVRALWDGDPAPAVRTSLWLLTVLVPLALGVSAATARLELAHSPFTWSLPGLRRALLTGTLVAAVALAGGLALFVGRSAPLPVVTATFAIALLAFLVPALVLDAVVPRALRWLGALVAGSMVLRPAAYADIVAAYPWPVALLALAITALIARQQFSARAARERLTRWSAFAPAHQSALYRARRAAATRRWAHDLTSGRLVPWLRAAEYEASLGRAWSFPGRHLLLASVVVLAGQLLNDPALMVILAGTFFIGGGVQFGSTLTYPLSRRERADLAYAGSLVDVIMFGALLAVVALLVQALPIPVLPWATEVTRPVGWPIAIGMAIAWAPIGQWSVVRGAIARPPLRDTPGARRVVTFMVYGVVAAQAARFWPAMDPLAAIGSVAALAVTLQLACWLAVRRHYDRADLLAGATS